jgi:hypothetical protein
LEPAQKLDFIHASNLQAVLTLIGTPLAFFYSKIITEGSMNKDQNKMNTKQRNLPDDSINSNNTAIPQSGGSVEQAAADPDQVANNLDYGKMNLDDAKASGYTDENGKAISKARKDVPGSPTGAYTDIGAGRSSVVHHHPDDKNKH